MLKILTFDHECIFNLLRSHLGSSPNPDTCNLTRRSSLDGIPFFLLVILGLVGIFWFTDVTATVHTLNCSSEDDFKEGDNQAEDQPDVDPPVDQKAYMPLRRNLFCLSTKFFFENSFKNVD